MLRMPVYVAPPAGAWIETDILNFNPLHDFLSHPLRVRGLKLFDYFFYPLPCESHPLRVRGLKH